MLGEAEKNLFDIEDQRRQVDPLRADQPTGQVPDMVIFADRQAYFYVARLSPPLFVTAIRDEARWLLMIERIPRPIKIAME